MRTVRKGLLVSLSGLIIVLLAAGTAWAQSASAKASASASASAGDSGGTFIEGTINIPGDRSSDAIERPVHAQRPGHSRTE